jgi:hypothetical protein
MADVYRQPTSGGKDSPRFKAYVALANGLPISNYNPLTSKPVLETIEALLAIDAESIAEPHAGSHELFITVAAEGLWTDRIATEVEHRLGEPSNQILLWTGEDTTAEAVRRETIAQVIRIERRARNTFEVAMREGYAYALAGDEGGRDPDVEAGPDDVPVGRLVPRRQRHAEVHRPGQERNRDTAHDHERPVPKTQEGALRVSVRAQRTSPAGTRRPGFGSCPSAHITARPARGRPSAPS